MTTDQDRADLLNLALQLEKLLKVIRHSDPSAPGKLKLLYPKYQSQLTKLAKGLKPRISWQQTASMIEGLIQEPKLACSTARKQTIISKLLKDFETQMITFHQPPELLKTEPQITRRKPTIKVKRIKPHAPTLEPEAEVHYTKEGILDMVGKVDKRRKATRQLQELISRLKRLDQNKLEEKIMKAFAKETKA